MVDGGEHIGVAVVVVIGVALVALAELCRGVSSPRVRQGARTLARLGLPPFRCKPSEHRLKRQRGHQPRVVHLPGSALLRGER